MTNDQINATANAIVNDYRSTKTRLSRLCATLNKLSKNPNDAAIYNKASQLAGRLNSACELVRPEIELPRDAESLNELRRLLLVASL